MYRRGFTSRSVSKSTDNINIHVWSGPSSAEFQFQDVSDFQLEIDPGAGEASSENVKENVSPNNTNNHHF